MKGLKIKEFSRIEKKEDIEKLSKWISEHDVKQLVLTDVCYGYRGFILYKPGKDESS